MPMTVNDDDPAVQAAGLFYVCGYPLNVSIPPALLGGSMEHKNQ